MNKGRHTSYQYRIGNMKGGIDIIRLRPRPDYTMPLQGLSYRGSKGEGHRNKIYLGRFPYLQGRLASQAGYTMLFTRVDAHVHYCIAVMPDGIHPPVLDFAHAGPPLDPGGDCGRTGRLWLLRVSLY